MNNLFLSLAIVLLIFNNAQAQTECITELTQEQVDYMNDTREEREIVDIGVFDNGITTIPIAAHIVRDANGKGGLSPSSLSLSIKQLNEKFSNVGFVFSLCTTNFIDNNDYFNRVEFSFNKNSDEYTMAKPNLVNGAVNIFFVPNPESSSGRSACGWSSFPGFLSAFEKDWTVMNNDCATNGSTLSHEIGHFFSLYHTHQGRSPSINVFEEELVDGSNCGDNVGDELCDTPAEPNTNSRGGFGISGCVNEACIYTCSERDRNNQLYTPNTSNLMSYSQKKCRNFLSPQQIERVQQSYIADRFYLSDGCTNNNQNTTCQVTDRAALIALYNSTDGPNWKNKWDLNADHSTWYGVGVGNDGCVKGLHLYKNRLNGNLPPEIGNLTNLIYLKVEDSNLTGEIPVEIKNLTKLQDLDLRSNNLEGTLLLELFTLSDLEILVLSGNQLSGGIPTEIKQLSKLKWLNLRNNKLKDEFPLELLSLPRLEIINFGQNQLYGTIPNEINILNNLSALYLNHNRFTGTIPTEIGDLTKLTHLYLGSNQLTGSFPASFSKLVNLKNFLLNRNRLEGCYAPELKVLCSQLLFSTLEPVSKLNNFDASWDDFCASGAGTCSCKSDKDALVALYNSTNGQNWTNKWNLNTAYEDWYGVTVNEDGCVTELDLSNNNLTGSIPAEIGNLIELEGLILNTNNLTGSISAEIGKLENLKGLYLQNNGLSGTIPSELGNLDNVRYLFLSFNNLSGNIPDELGKLSSLAYLGLYYNNLTGSIPGSFSNSNIARLYVHDNKLSGCFPAELDALCDIYNFKATDIDKGNNFDASWEDFCNTGAGACKSSNNDFANGDYNQDGVANHADAIYLGLSYGNTGVACALEENKNDCPDWQNEVNGVNAKFHDGDGNGIINEADLKTIEDNYGISTGLNPVNATLSDFSFKVELVNESANEITFDLYVEGTSNVDVAAHGLACSIDLGKLKVTKAKVDYTKSSLEPALVMDKLNALDNTLDISISRTDKINKKINGPIASITIIIAENIDTDGYILNVFKLNSLDASGVLSEGISSIFDSKDGNFKLNGANIENEYLSQNKPNPFSDETSIEYFIPKHTKTANLNVYSLTGRLLQTKPIEHVGSGNLNIRSTDLNAGLYIYSIEIDGVSKASKRMIIH